MTGLTLSPEQTAKELTISTKTLMRHVRDGEISYIEVGRGRKRRAIRFAASDITAFIDNHRRTKPCLSKQEGKAGRITTHSALRVYDFMDRLKRPTARKPKSLRRPRGTKR